jgi:hypothetical protein
MGHSHVAYALADRLNITGIAEAEALNAGRDFCLGF